MQSLSVNQLSILTGKTRETCAKALQAVPFEIGPKAAKLYNSVVALNRIYRGDPNEGGEDAESNTEAARLLTIARRKQIELQMESERGERIPLEDVAAINQVAFSNIAGMIKAHEGKVFTPEAIQDILTELRGAAEQEIKLPVSANVDDY